MKTHYGESSRKVGVALKQTGLRLETMKSNKFVDVLVASSDEPRKSTLWNTLQTGTLLKETHGNPNQICPEASKMLKRIPNQAIPMFQLSCTQTPCKPK
ncbi:hypothetical protein FOXG_20011 [Fusarium oxysporum f. sp. lycopersici 4287]|uniref:Uncharacterized protein n=2 Tax=Fusarium oxysporum TaxID=5507 RepID=A0A0J9WP23_FUSO4|nr:hypothetical protein FOXG_20011 [Fusarium oxysporum f. sp. lycopersici 4287]EXK37204.1 hypothetical protein FOMG_08042 [Fusarium oxysporum f. sp. melonis 26406]KNB08282.1 hypothetical protein FOXG_20011 [Fusarium oxysporum f. sp. lycopersici 4287]